MIKKLVISFALVPGLAGFSNSWAQKDRQSKMSVSRAEVKFLDDIVVDLGAAAPEEKTVTLTPSRHKVTSPAVNASVNSIYIESTPDLHFKYALLLNTEVEQVRNTKLFSAIDEWYGTPYQYGGNSKSGIDCSAFVQTLYTSAYGISLPRTAREQYDFTQDPAPSEMLEGDLVFFNTTGGVSHVGFFLQNYKFVHAATTGGVMISDLREPYWAARFIGAGRLNLEAGKKH